MADNSDFIEGCPSCKQFSGKTVAEIAKGSRIYASGTVEIIDGEKYVWVVIPSGKSSVVKGRHLIFTTISHHVGAEEVVARCILNAEATKAAANLLDSNFRLVSNFGGASTRDHYHVQMIQAGEGEALPRVVANIPAVITDVQKKYGLPQEAVDEMLAGIMQK
jgi:hypothetical protein